MEYENSLYRSLARLSEDHLHPDLFGSSSIEDIQALADKDKPSLIQSRDRFPDASESEDFIII